MTHRAGLALFLVLAACGRQPAAPVTTATFEDPEGHPITIDSLPVERIVSTMQSATEWLMALGAGDRLVARTDFDRQPELAALPSIGGGLDPSPEAVAALKPDMVIGWHNSSSTNLAHALAPFHIPVVSFETTDTADLFHDLAGLGALVGRERRADSLAAALRSQLDSVGRTACPNGLTRDRATMPTVLIVVWADPPMTTGGGTWMNSVVETACLRNLFDDLGAAWPTVSLEAILARNPAWLLTSSGTRPGQRLEEFRGKTGWRDLEAVKAGHVLEISGDLLARAGPTIAEAARAIAAATKAILATKNTGAYLDRSR